MATNIKLLDENALSAIKTYVDTKVGQAGKVDDVKINSTSVVTSKIANIAVDGTYNSSSNKIATQTTVSNAIGALDVPASGTGAITGFGAGKTLASLTETDGKIAATFQNITITESQVTNLTTDLAAKVPTSRTIAGLALSSNISSADLITALGLQQAMTYIGVATTTKPSAGHYVQTVIGGTTYYVSMDSTGGAQQENAVKGQILTIGSKEYICTTAGASGTNVFSELGDESSYALKTITISSGSGLSGGGNLSANRTISHAVPTGAATKSSGFYKFSTDGFGHVNGTTAVAKADLTGLGVADDSLVVHLSGAETITGVKTFAANTLKLTGDHGTITTVTGGTGGEYFAGLASSGNVIANSGSLIVMSGSSKYTKYSSESINLVDTGGGGTYNYTLALPIKDGTIATLDDIPSNYVTTNTAQTISGKKTFSHANGIAISNAGATATLSVTNSSESGELNIGGVSYLEASNIKANFGVIETNGEVTKYFGRAELRSDVFVPKDYVIKTASYSDEVGDATYGIKIPDTHGYTANRTLATTADIPSVSDFVTKSTAQSITGAKTFNNGTILMKDGNTTGVTTFNRTSSSGSYTITFPANTGTVALTSDIPSVSGFVTGPSSATSGAIALYDTTSGKKIKNSAITTQTNDMGFVFGNAGTDEYNYIRFSSANRVGTHGLVIKNQSYNISGASISDTFLYIESTGTTALPKKSYLGTGENHFYMAFIDNLSDGDNNIAFSTLNTHLSNSTIHITSAERTAWNAKISAVKSLKTDATATQSTSSSEALSGSGTVTLHRISKTGKLSHLLSDDGGSVSVITTAEINAILYPSA